MRGMPRLLFAQKNLLQYMYRAPAIPIGKHRDTQNVQRLKKNPRLTD
jgi:hypothetical protein